MISAQADSSWASAPYGNGSHVEKKKRGGGGDLWRGIKKNKSRLCKAKETWRGCELQYTPYPPRQCIGWGVGLGAQGSYSPGEKSWAAQEPGCIHTHARTHARTQTVNCGIWCRRTGCELEWVKKEVFGWLSCVWVRSPIEMCLSALSQVVCVTIFFLQSVGELCCETLGWSQHWAYSQICAFCAFVVVWRRDFLFLNRKLKYKTGRSYKVQKPFCPKGYIHVYLLSFIMRVGMVY